MDIIKNQLCPVCHKKKLALTEDRKEIPFFGPVYIFSMKCEACNYYMGDVEAETQKEPSKYTFTIQKEKDLKIRVIKGSQATVSVPQLRMKVEPVNNSDGYVSNIEGVLDRFVKVIENQRDTTEDDKVKKHAKNLLKKLRKVKYGDIPLKIIIEDPTGNSAIITDKAKIEKLKKK